MAPPALVSQFENLSGKVSQLKSMVAAEEGAVVNAQRAAVLERQTQRLSREEELIKQSRRLAPGTALMEFGSALAGAKPGESFASALARGLQAGSKSYTGARDTREASLRGIEERRDALILQNEDAIEKARADAITLSRAGVELDKEQFALTKLGRDDVKALATQQADINLAVANAKKAEVEAANAQAVIDAGIRESDARAYNLRQPPSSGGSSGGGISPTQAGLRAKEAKNDLDTIAKSIIASERAGTHSLTYDLLTDYANARTAFNNAAIVSGRSPITTTKFPTNLPKFNKYLKERQAKRGKTNTGGGGQSRPAGVGNDWKLETDAKGNRAWVNPSRTKYVEI